MSSRSKSIEEKRARCLRSTTSFKASQKPKRERELRSLLQDGWLKRLGVSPGAEADPAAATTQKLRLRGREHTRGVTAAAPQSTLNAEVILIDASEDEVPARRESHEPASPSVNATRDGRCQEGAGSSLQDDRRSRRRGTVGRNSSGITSSAAGGRGPAGVASTASKGRSCDEGSSTTWSPPVAAGPVYKAPPVVYLGDGDDSEELLMWEEVKQIETVDLEED